MKAKKLRTMIVAFVAAGTVAPIFAQAESLESLQEQESTIMQQSQAISAEVQIALTDVNKTYSEVESLKAQIAENEDTLAQTKSDIATAQDTIEKREAVVAERMKDIQVNGGATRDWTALLESANIQDFINRAYAITMLQNLEKEKIDALSTEKEKLESLQNKAEKTQASLTEDQASLEEQAQALDSKINNLQAQLKDNESTLAQIASSKEAEESRLAAEKQQKKKPLRKRNNKPKLLPKPKKLPATVLLTMQDHPAAVLLQAAVAHQAIRQAAPTSHPAAIPVTPAIPIIQDQPVARR